MRVESGKFGVDGGGSDGDVYVGVLPADITSPASRVDRDVRRQSRQFAKPANAAPAFQDVPDASTATVSRTLRFPRFVVAVAEGLYGRTVEVVLVLVL